MKNKSGKTQKRLKNSIFWIYGYHATVAALRNSNRRKYELLITLDAQKRISQENNLNALKEVKQKILKGNFKMPSHLSPNCKDLIYKMLT